MNPLSGGMKVAIYIITWIFVYLCAVTFIPMFFKVPVPEMELAKMIVAFLLGILGTLIGYYWGNKSSGTPQLDLDKAAKEFAIIIEAKRLEAAKKDAEEKEAARIKLAKEVAEEVIEEATIKSQEATA